MLVSDVRAQLRDICVKVTRCRAVFLHFSCSCFFRLPLNWFCCAPSPGGEETWVWFWSLTNSQVMFLTLQLHPTISEPQTWLRQAKACLLLLLVCLSLTSP